MADLADVMAYINIIDPLDNNPPNFRQDIESLIADIYATPAGKEGLDKLVINMVR